MPTSSAALAQPARDSLLTLSPGKIWQYLLTQGPSFWFLNIYVFFEYVRPQHLYPSIDFFPWLRTALLLSFICAVFEGNPPRPRTSVCWWLLIFSVIVGASIVTAYSPETSMKHLDLFFVWVLVYFLIINVVNTEKRFLVFMTAFMLYHFQMSLGSTKQWIGIGFRFRSWGLTGGAGWFNNSGDYGVALCIFLPMSIYFYLAVAPHLDRLWKKILVAAMPATALITIIGCSSRGALVGAAAVGLWMLMRTRYRVRGLVALLAVAAIVNIALPPEQKARFDAAGKDKTSLDRLTFWRQGAEMLRENPVHGIGYYNWLTYYGRRIDATPTLPHNLFVLAMAELGYPGIIVLSILMILVFVFNRRTRKLAERDPPGGRFISLMSRGLDGGLIGLMVAGFFDTVTWYPFFWFHLAMTVALYEVARRKYAPAVVPVRKVSRLVTKQLPPMLPT
jgi:putative inorganic carbon (hco3(-)) transporter